MPSHNGSETGHLEQPHDVQEVTASLDNMSDPPLGSCSIQTTHTLGMVNAL